MGGAVRELDLERPTPRDVLVADEGTVDAVGQGGDGEVVLAGLARDLGLGTVAELPAASRFLIISSTVSGK